MTKYYRGTKTRTTEIYDANGLLTGKEIVTEDYDLDAVDSLEDIDGYEDLDGEDCECKCVGTTPEEDELDEKTKQAIKNHFTMCLLSEKIEKESKDKQDAIVDIVRWLKNAGFKVVE